MRAKLKMMGLHRALQHLEKTEMFRTSRSAAGKKRELRIGVEDSVQEGNGRSDVSAAQSSRAAEQL
jgi:hypothetical protein